MIYHPTPGNDVFDALVGEYRPVVYGYQTGRPHDQFVDVLLSPSEQLSLKNRHPRSLEHLPSTSLPRLVRDEIQPSTQMNSSTSLEESPESPSAEWGEPPQNSYDEGSLRIKSSDTSLDRLIKELEELESFSCDGHSVPCLCSEDDNNRRASDPDVATDFERKLFDWIDCETKQPALASCTALQVAVSHLESPRRTSVHSIESARSAGLDSPCSEVITEGYRADGEGSPAVRNSKGQSHKNQYRRGSRIYVRHVLHSTVVRVRRGSIKIEGVNSTLRRPSILSPAAEEDRHQNRRRSVTFVEPQKKYVNVEQWGDPFAGSKAFGKQRELFSPRVGVRPRALTSPQVIDAGPSWTHAGPSRKAYPSLAKLVSPSVLEDAEGVARPALIPLEPIPLPRRVSRTRTKSCSQGMDIAPVEAEVDLPLETEEDPPQGGFPLPISGPLRGLNAPNTAEVGGSGFEQQCSNYHPDDFLPAEKRDSLAAWAEGTLAASFQSALISPSVVEVQDSPSMSREQVQSDWIPLVLEKQAHPSSTAAVNPFMFDKYMRRIPSDAMTTTSTLITEEVAKERRASHRQVRAMRRQIVSPTARRPVRISSIPMSHPAARTKPSPIVRQFSCPSRQLACVVRSNSILHSPSPGAWLASARSPVLTSRTCSAPGKLDAAMILPVPDHAAALLRPEGRERESISPGSHRTTDLPCSPAWRSTPSSSGLPPHVLGHNTVDFPTMGLGLSLPQPVHDETHESTA